MVKNIHMGRILTFAILILLGLSNCRRDEINYYLDSFNKNNYYSKEIIPEEYQTIYGKWKLIGISGGFSGSGYKPDFDFMEIKSIGIYGLIKNDSVFEYGRIEIDTFDNATTNYLQIILNPDYYSGLSQYMYPPEKYVDLRGDSLNLYSPCCDMFNYHFKRIK
jgi:hypothetical protein